MKSIIDTAKRFAENRVLQLGKGNSRFKINSRELKEEISTAAMFGELSAFERLVAELVTDKSLTREDIEAKLHLAIVDLYNLLGPKLNDRGLPVKLEDYLKLRGYYGKSSGSAVIENVQ